MARHTAFEILYRDYYPRVYGLCRRLLGSGELAQDATQETFMRAYKSFHKFDVEQPFWHWVAAIANNHCIDQLRKRSSSEPLFGSFEDENIEPQNIASSSESTLSELCANESAEALHQAVNNLPDKYRAPVVLAYFQEQSYDDIAATLEINRNHVGVLLLRARGRLKVLLAAASSGANP